MVLKDKSQDACSKQSLLGGINFSCVCWTIWNHLLIFGNQQINATSDLIVLDIYSPDRVSLEVQHSTAITACRIVSIDSRDPMRAFRCAMSIRFAQEPWPSMLRPAWRGWPSSYFAGPPAWQRSTLLLGLLGGDHGGSWWICCWEINIYSWRDDSAWRRTPGGILWNFDMR